MQSERVWLALEAASVSSKQQVADSEAAIAISATAAVKTGLFLLWWMRRTRQAGTHEREGAVVVVGAKNGEWLRRVPLVVYHHGGVIFHQIME